jgi:uncharacterized membrane protein YccC
MPRHAIDGRATFQSRFNALAAAFTKDLGGAPNETEQALITQAATICARLEQLQAKLMRGESIDDATLTKLTALAARILQMLGVRARKHKAVVTLDDLDFDEEQS